MSARWATHVNGWLLLLPAAVLLVTFTHYPAVATFIDSFFSTPKGARPAVFVGLDNYREMVSDRTFWVSIRVTLKYMLLSVPLYLVCGLLLSLLLNLKIRGIDAVDVPDGPLAEARMSALSTAVLIEQRAGIETVLHYACRDRNLLGMESDLLGAHAMGIRNLLLVTGDPPRRGDYAFATGVYDVDSIGLTNVVTRLNHGVDVGGEPLAGQTAYHIGVAVNPTALDMDYEIRRFEFKVEAGAEYAVTQPLFDLGAFEAFMKRVEHLKVPILVGLWPFDSLRNAEFLANEVPGVRVPDHYLRRMRAADSQAAAAEGVAIAREIAVAVKGRVQGFQLSNAAGRIQAALEVLDGLL